MPDLGMAGTGATCEIWVAGGWDGMNCAARWEVGSEFEGAMMNLLYCDQSWETCWSGASCSVGE